MSGFSLTFNYNVLIMNTKKLQLEQLETKIEGFLPATKIIIPPTGWIKAIRSALGMSLQQLAHKLSITKQSVGEMEQREKEGTITLRLLQEVACALDMRLVYGFVPNDGSLDKLIEKRARELAVKIVSRTSTTMTLEDQQNSDKRLKNAVAERTTSIKEELPKILWD